MHRAFKYVVLGSTLGLKTLKKIFLWLNVTVVQVKHSCLFEEDQLTQLSTNPFNKAKTDETVNNR